jgi:hypothetical protein
MNIERDFNEELQLDIAESKSKVQELMKCEMLDEDGYPTTECLDIIRIWHWSDPSGYLQFIKSVWFYSNIRWNERDEEHDFKKKMVHRHYISTCGWSGNESIIKAMQENEMMWHFNWVQSRRGGHYIFEEYEFGGKNEG